MRHAWVFLLFIALTGPAGNVIWITPDAIEAVLADKECPAPAQTTVRAQTNNYCVRETIAEVLAKIEKEPKE